MCLYLPKHIRHFFASPASPNTAPERGSFIFPHENHLQIVVSSFDITRCAILLRVLTTPTTVASSFGLSFGFCAQELLVLDLLAATGASYLLNIMGVAGAAEVSRPACCTVFEAESRIRAPRGTLYYYYYKQLSYQILAY